MTGRTHLYAGVAASAYLLLHAGAPLTAFPGALAAAAVGALLPDIDEPHSRAAHAVPIAGAVAGEALKHSVGHRTATHSLLALALLYFGVHALWPQVPRLVLLSGALGFASHLLLDALTPEGVDLLWPFDWLLHLPRLSLVRWLPRAHLFKTQGFLEVLLFRPGLLLALVVLAWDVVAAQHIQWL